jgi:hypothetical protein
MAVVYISHFIASYVWYAHDTSEQLVKNWMQRSNMCGGSGASASASGQCCQCGSVIACCYQRLM